MKVLFALFVSIGLVACSGNSNTEKPFPNESSEEISLTTPIHNSTSTFSIEGMTCEIGCVRTVKSHLSKMNGVIDIEMKFDTARTVDYSVVKFDSKLVSETEMKDEIESIANGLYSVVDVTQQDN